MTDLAYLAWLNIALNFWMLAMLRYYHRQSVDGPGSAAGRIIADLAALRARLEMLELLLPLLREQHQKPETPA